MARRVFDNCTVCGESFMPSPRAKVALYCSSKCKQKAHYNRKKAEQKAKDRTISMFDEQAYQYFTVNFPDICGQLNAIKSKHGKQALLDMIKVFTTIHAKIQENA